MIENFEMRKSVPSDLVPLENLYSKAFPDEDLWPLVKELLHEEALLLSLVATVKETIVGHIMFTQCAVTGHVENVALLAPLGVLPSYQKQGIGSALVQAGLQKLNAIQQVHVLGDPSYYGRFGFVQDDFVLPPYPIPKEWKGAWQILRLHEEDPLKGKLEVPKVWQKKEFWSD